QEDRFDVVQPRQEERHDPVQVVHGDGHGLRCARGGEPGRRRMRLGAMVPGPRSPTGAVAASNRLSERGRLCQGPRPAREGGSQGRVRHGERRQDQGTGRPARRDRPVSPVRQRRERGGHRVAMLPGHRGSARGKSEVKPGTLPRAVTASEEGRRRRKRWSLSVPMDAFALPELSEVAREAERLGYTDAWSFEVDGIDAFTPLAVIGLATSMRLGTAIANVYTRGPATLASTAAGLADLAPGRFVLGIGAGSQPIVESWNGGTFSRPATRVREMAQFLRAALAGERVVFKGETFTVDGFRLTKAP